MTSEQLNVKTRGRTDLVDNIRRLEEYADSTGTR